MGSLFSSWLRLQIRLLKPVLNHMDINKSRAAQDRLGNLAEHVMAGKVDFVPIEHYNDDTACWALPHHAHADAVILYLHGGGYVAGSLPYAKHFGGMLAAACQKNIFCLGYSLAPEHPYPAALDDAYAAYLYLLERGIHPGKISLVGESAGGGLIFCLLHKLISEKQPLPAAIVAISPWMDLTLSGASYTYNKRKDITLTIKQLTSYANHYAPRDKTNKFVSPIFGDFDGFPPGLIIAGGNELLLDDAYQAEKKYQQAGVQVQLIVEPKMWHAYPLYATPEAKEVLVKINHFIDANIIE